MCKLKIMALVALAVLSASWKTTSAAPYQTIHTHTNFGSLFVLATDSRGNLYVADQSHYAILKLSPSGRLLLKDSMPTQCGISGLAASSAGDVYAVANCQGLVYHFSPSGRLLLPFGHQPPTTNGVAVDGQGHVYVTYGTPAGPRPGPPPGVRVMSFANRFVEFTGDGRPLRTVKLPGIHFPWGIAVDSHGNVYVTGADGLVKVSSTGNIVGRWSRVLPVKAKYVLPSQPAVDTHGDVYVADDSGSILKISATGQLVGVVVAHGSGANAVKQAVGLTIDNSGHLFVGEAGPNRIKEFSLNGSPLAVWTP